ncbi:MAG TPA: zinc ABC transporter substrate-binding protein, partial [Candidatus Obscuribacterales bacterium]
VKNGLEMEFFLDDLVANAGNADLVVIDTSEGVAVLSNEDVEGHGDEHGDDHGHDHGDDPDHNHGDDQAAESGDSHAGHVHHGAYNPHIWLDPKRVIQQVETIRDGLIAVDPDGETDYTTNAAAYIEQLQALDAEFTERLAPYAGQTFVAFHDFAPYFAESYGLEAEFLVDVPDVNPSPEDVRRVIETVEASSLKTLLTEPQAGDEAFASLAGDLNVKVSAFDPMETGDPTATEPEAYFTIMRQNVDVLEAAFSSSVQSRLSPWIPQPLASILQPTGTTRPFATVAQPVGVR